MADEGYIMPEYIEEMELPYIEKGDCFTQMGDILVRLSAPYTAVMIKNKNNVVWLYLLTLLLLGWIKLKLRRNMFIGC